MTADPGTFGHVVQPGRETDRQIAERVTCDAGVTHFLASDDGGRSMMFMSRQRGEVERFVQAYQGYRPGLEVVESVIYPPYSTDLDAACQVLATIGGFVKIVRRPASDAHGVEWMVRFDDGASGCWAETLPLAICRAALAITLDEAVLHG